MQSLQAASASPRCGAETAITTEGSPMPTRPTRCAIATAQRSYVRSRSAASSLHHLLGHALVGLVVEMQHGAATGVDARRPDEHGDAARALVGHLGDDGRWVERLLAEPVGASGHGRDQRHLVAVGQLPVGRGVLAVDRVEQALRLRAEIERSPHVANPIDAVEVALGPASALAQAGEESHPDLHHDDSRHYDRGTGSRAGRCDMPKPIRT